MSNPNTNPADAPQASRFSSSSTRHSATPTMGNNSTELPETRDPEKYERPFSYGFFSRDPQMARVRRAYLKELATKSFIVVILIWAVLPIYWAALWHTDSYVHRLQGWVVDFDGGYVGTNISQSFSSFTGADMITWTVHSSNNFPNGPSDLEHLVLEEKIWVGVAIRENTTQALNSAISNVDSSYNSTDSIAVFVTEARQENGYDIVIQPLITRVLTKICQEFATKFTPQLATNANLARIAQTAPSIILQPVYYNIINLRPFDVPVATAMDFVGMIYLLILAFIVAMMHYNIRIVDTKIDRQLTLGSLICLRILAPLATYFFISLFYALVSLAFLAPFDRKFGHAGFFLYWMLSWMGMSAMGLAVESLITILTPRFIQFFLVLWLIANVAACYYPLDLLPPIFQYGYAAPFYNVGNAVRTIVFDTKNQVGLNFGVLIAWVAVSCITMPFFVWLARRKEMKAMRKREEKDD